MTPTPSSPQQATSTDDKKIHLAPWETTFDRVLNPLDNFIHKQTTSSMVLMTCTVLAMAITNSRWGEHYLHLLHTPLGLSLGETTFQLGLLHWINEALMTAFFLMVGLELKRELLVGELADIRRASLPIIAAIGGMAVPALFYWLWNPTGIATAGWGIPMATDIAFAIGAVSLLGKRAPPGLATFLIALAIVDDLGAVLVIALFYTAQLNFAALAVAGMLTLALVALNLGGIRRVAPYAALGFLLWCAMLNSGVHATLAGIIMAFTIPMKPKYNPEHFIAEVRALTDDMTESLKDQPDIHNNSQMRAQITALEEGTELVQAPAQRLEEGLHMSVAFLIIPLFALANAAIPIHVNNFAETLLHPVTLGVITGLVIGKWLGVTLASWLAVRSGIASLPTGLSMLHVNGIGLLAGIGFTMSIFVADLAFTNAPDLLLMAKTGILFASVISGVGGYCWLRFVCPCHKVVTDAKM